VDHDVGDFRGAPQDGGMELHVFIACLESDMLTRP